ncbi:MAG: AmmeMemoRadiSam system radical SAM enzyme [Oscillospiraceae bacterium]|nr:AmmeMemoRadiSam system radical SAM enzyme [Oscillospiraceae bacterium]
MVNAEFYETVENNLVRCNLCPHECLISNGNTGFCRTRVNLLGTLYSKTYGHISSIALDRVEKKPLYQFHPGKYLLSIGSYSCNMRCGFCQNYEISQEYDEDFASGRSFLPSEIVDMAVYLKPKGNIGIAYTYNEPLINYEFVSECAKISREHGLLNVLVTNGFINEQPLVKILPYIDAANIDLKSFSDDFYRSCDGAISTVKNTIEIMYKYCHIEVTTLVIPDENDSVSNIDALTSWLASIGEDIPLFLSRFFPRYQYLGYNPTSIESLKELKQVAERHLKYVYLGNV